jgi:hypothetical protein
MKLTLGIISAIFTVSAVSASDPQHPSYEIAEARDTVLLSDLSAEMNNGKKPTIAFKSAEDIGKFFSPTSETGNFRMIDVNKKICGQRILKPDSSGRLQVVEKPNFKTLVWKLVDTIRCSQSPYFDSMVFQPDTEGQGPSARIVVTCRVSRYATMSHRPDIHNLEVYKDAIDRCGDGKVEPSNFTVKDLKGIKMILPQNDDERELTPNVDGILNYQETPAAREIRIYKERQQRIEEDKRFNEVNLRGVKGVG